MKGLSEQGKQATLAGEKKTKLNPIHAMKKTPQTKPQSNARVYALEPALVMSPANPMAAAKVTLSKMSAAATAPVPARQPLPKPLIEPAKPMLKLGLDVHLEFIMVVAQRGHSAPQAPRKFSREELVAYVTKAVAEGLQVFCVQESCGFGFILHRQLVAAGAQSFVITPIALNGKRKTDKLDARALCVRLTRWMDGDPKELSPIRIPSPEEQRRRESSRRREFLGRELRCLANRGHGQVAEYCHAKLPSHWWGPRNWKKLSNLDPWVLGLLEKLRALILDLERQLKELTVEVKSAVRGQPRPKAIGELSLATLDNEMCSWYRFYNRKQVGSYTGCCPGEHSSGNKRRMGSIDRIGNGRVRALLVEAVWRFVKWQPGWKAAQRMKAKLADGTSMRKKAAIALARLLAIDLWRWRTGRATFEDLGWVAA